MLDYKLLKISCDKATCACRAVIAAAMRPGPNGMIVIKAQLRAKFGLDESVPLEVEVLNINDLPPEYAKCGEKKQEDKKTETAPAIEPITKEPDTCDAPIEDAPMPCEAPAPQIDDVPPMPSEPEPLQDFGTSGAKLDKASNTVYLNCTSEEFERKQQEMARFEAQQKGYNSTPGEHSFYKQSGGYSYKGDGKHNKRKLLTPPEGEEPPKDSQGNVILLGSETHQVKTPMAELTDQSGLVLVEGTVFKSEEKKIPSGSHIMTFAITDETSSISAKFFFQEEDVDYVTNFFKKNTYLRVYGEVVYDKFIQSYSLKASSIVAIKKPKRVDNAPKKRVELHLHTNMSAVDAITRPGPLMEQVCDFGHKAIAITDHGVVQGFSEITRVYKDKYKDKMPDFKFIYGCEGYLCDRTPDMDEKTANAQPTYHIIILVKNLVGLKNLYQLISKSNLDYYHKRPRMPRFEIEAHREGLIIGSACSEGELYNAILEGKSDEELMQMASYYDYLEIQPTGNNMYLVRSGVVDGPEELIRINKKIVEIGDKIGKKTVATCDVHFLNPSDAIYREVMQAGQGYDDYMYQPPLYYRSTEEMLKEFEYLGDRAEEIVVDNTNEIADMIEKIKPVPDGNYPPNIPGSDENLRNSAIARCKEIYGDPIPEIVEKRLMRELNNIIDNGYSIMYITAKELVAESKRNGYTVGSRGSVGSSLAAYMAGITEVNSLPAHYRCPCGYLEFHENEGYDCGFDMPVKKCPNCGKDLIRDGFDIPFETFLGFNGDKVPDIDLNFASDDQPNAHRFTEVLFGKGKVFRAGTISGLAEKNARGYVLKYLERSGKTVSNTEISRLASGFEGVKKTTGQHPGGIIVVPRDKDIYDFTPIQHPADKINGDTITTHIEFKYLHDTLLKLDILGHEGPEMLRLLEDFSGINSVGVDINDPKVLTIFSSPDALGIDMSKVKIDMKLGTFGIPEFGTNFVIRTLLDTKPTHFSELVRISGLSHGTDVWSGNAEILIRDKICTLSQAICCRDDIMLYLINKGLEKKTAFDIMEKVRKGKGLTPAWEEDMRNHDVPEWYIESCNKIKYMFPKAHAVAYCILSLRIAWFKVYKPTSYYSARFTLKIDDFDAVNMIHGLDKVYGRMAIMNILGDGAALFDDDDDSDFSETGESKKSKHEDDEEGEGGKTTLSAKDKQQAALYYLIVELYARGISFLPIDIYESKAKTFYPVDEKTIRPAIASLPGLGIAAAEAIEAESARRKARGDKYISIEDFQMSTGVNKNVVELLRAEGCLDGLPESNQLSLFD